VAAPGQRLARRRDLVPWWRWRLHVLSAVAAVIGLAVVGSLVWLADVANEHTQEHLLQLQAGEAGIILGEASSTIKTPLETAAGIADVSAGNRAEIVRYLGGDVGTHGGSLFRSLSVWRLSAAGPVRVLSLGVAPEIGVHSPVLARFLDAVPDPDTLTVKGLIGRSPPSLGFAVESLGATPRYVVYAEVALPAHRHATVPVASAFHELGFALYLGRHARPAELIESTATRVPTSGPVTTVMVPFGTATFDFVAWATQPLGGAVLPSLPWIILGVGVVLVATGAVMTEWLVRRRRLAERLARENRRLYTEQRSIAQKLQEALLPKVLPQVEGMEIAARYISGDPAADIGGDWYDVIRCDDRSFVFAVGDVSGRGVPAANTMASLHYAIRAYAAQGDDPQTILGKLTELLDVARDGHFATVLLGHVDVRDRRLTIANAGHLPPLLVSGGEASYVETANGGPIGVTTDVRYRATTVQLPAGASLLVYTDGLVERRGEILDAGLERLRLVVAGGRADCRSLLDAAASLSSEGFGDDVAMLALRWTT
jgi:hypothetical protein